MKVKLTHISLIIIVIIAGIMLYITHYANKNDTIAEEAAGESSHGYSTVLEEMGLISPQQALQDYKQLSIYPPNSRPLSKENIDLLMPNRRYEQPLPIEEGSDIYYLFTADKYRVVGDDTITFVLIVLRGTKPDSERIPIAITKSVIKKGLNKNKAKYYAELSLAKNTTGDYTAELTCSQSFSSEKKSSAYWAEVEFNAGNEHVEAAIPFEYFPENTIPAKFTGNFKERIADGSLYIDVEIDVLRKGYYIVDANLFDAEGEPVAYTVQKQELQSGKQMVPLLFFGKVLLDKKAKPPLTLKDLRGYRFIEATTPDPEFMDREMMKPYDGEYKTRLHSLQGLSDKEFEDAMKRKRIEFLEKENTGDIGVQ
ncbi:MAG TPA: hypothetical protein PLX22_00235 [Spirochaetota bacterium]|nr:hypothetical protein [Spirochaetota bacterium]